MIQATIRGIRSSLILFFDLIIILLTFSYTYYLRIGQLPDFQSLDLWLIYGTFIITLFLAGTYFRERSTTRPRLPIKTFWACAAAGLICVGWLYVLGPGNFNQYFGRGVLPVATLACGLSTTLIRYFVNGIYHRQEEGIELLYLGYSVNTLNFLNELKSHSEVRCITISCEKKPHLDLPRVSWANKPTVELERKNHWHSIIVDPEFSADKTQTHQLIQHRLGGTPVVSLANFYERYWFMIPIAGIDDDWFLRSQGFSVLDNPIARRVKRLLDVVFSIIVIIISSPLLLICAFTIKLTSSGPIFYRQQRVGLNGQLFTIIKLRTMHHNAETDGAQWAQANDPRITLIGGLLRAMRLDEIPQCWNVLKGEMSFVGPRPERPEFTQKLAKQIPYYHLRHLVKPGITGWAQVIFPYGASVEDAFKKLQYEIFYIKNQSLILDLNIIIRTVIIMFQRSGR